MTETESHDNSSIEWKIKMSRVLTSVGILLTVAPLGLILITWISDNVDELIALAHLAWVWWITMALLPLGIAFFLGGLGWMVMVKREIKRTEDAE
jgi:hypothetical protein